MKNKLKLRIKPQGAILCLAAVCVLVWFFSALFDVIGVGKECETIVNIPKGASVSDIADILADEGVVRHRLIFRIVERAGGAHLFQHGGHTLMSNASYKKIIEKLTSAPEFSADEIVKLLVPEGYEARQIAAEVERLGLADAESFMDELENGKFDYAFISDIARRENRLEGYLFPATYEIVRGESAHSIIDRMLRKFSEVVPPLYAEWDNPRGMSLDELVCLASLVEREAANDSERSRIASVFLNRLDLNMTLSSCATVQYILKERKTILSQRDVKIKSDYNTYINHGLPPGPIASPGESSIRAAMHPENSDYLYFAARADGSANIFSKTGEEHMKTVRELQGQ